MYENREPGGIDGIVKWAKSKFNPIVRSKLKAKYRKGYKISEKKKSENQNKYINEFFVKRNLYYLNWL